MTSVITYECETLVKATTEGDSNRTIGRKVLKKIFGPALTIWKTYERRHNADVQNIYGKFNILLYSRSRRIERFSYVWRINEKIIKQITE